MSACGRDYDEASGQLESASPASITDVRPAEVADDQENIDAECERLLKNTKKQVKQMMEEAVTKKFIHEESSSIISLCVSVDACLSHKLRRRALGLFKTNSSTALVQKVAKCCPSAQEVLELVEAEERRILEERKQRERKLSNYESNQSQLQASQQSRMSHRGSAFGIGQNSCPTGSSSLIGHGATMQLASEPSNLQVHRRNLWIKCALIEKKLVSIIDHLATNYIRYYEPGALMSNCLCAQILSSLLEGPSALEFRRGPRPNDQYPYYFEDPSADELLERHKIATPVACLCISQSSWAHSEHTPLARSRTELPASYRTRRRNTSELGNVEPTDTTSSQHTSRKQSTQLDKSATNAGSPVDCSPIGGDFSEPPASPNSLARKNSRRRPLALKTNALMAGTLVTECHHYTCQELSEHKYTRGYTYFSYPPVNSACCVSGTPSTNAGGTQCPSTPMGSLACQQSVPGGSANVHANCLHPGQPDLPLWSPRMLHETLHQNPRSNLLYAKNNVLLAIQPDEYIAGYLSLHQTSSDLTLKWIPNQMINGSHLATMADHRRQSTGMDNEPKTSCSNDNDNNNNMDNNDNGAAKVSKTASNEMDPTGRCSTTTTKVQPTPVESSYLDHVICISVWRIVLVHCQFGQTFNRTSTGDEDLKSSNPAAARDEILVLVEADGVHRAPFKFPKGGLKSFLSCLDNGLRPERYLDPAIKLDDGDQFDDANQPTSEQTVVDSPRSPLGRLFSNIDSATNSGGEAQQPTGVAGRLDNLLRRLPSLKRPKGNSAPANDDNTSIRTGSISPQAIERLDRWPCLTEDEPNDELKQRPNSDGINMRDQAQAKGNSRESTSSRVYRIVSQNSQSCDLSSSTPPQSAKIASSANNAPTNVSNGGASSSSGSTGQVVGQRFRWSLTRLAGLTPQRTSTQSTGSTQSSPFASQSTQTTLNEASMTQQVSNSASSMDLEDQQQSGVGASGRDPVAQLARIEAKLDDLKKSVSEEVLALRTQSVANLCESMRRQIVARAFYGWLVYCRKARIIRRHLTRLINDDCDHSLLEANTRLLDCQQAGGLTMTKWLELTGKRARLSERQLARKVCRAIYLGGIESDELRREVWPCLLGHHKFRDTEQQRKARDEAVRRAYEAAARDWTKIERVVKQRDNELLAANIARANRSRTASESSANRTQDSAGETLTSLESMGGESSGLLECHNENEETQLRADIDESLDENDENEKETSGLTSKNHFNSRPNSATNRQLMNKTNQERPAGKRRRRRARLESTGSVGSDASITDQFGNNVHRIDKDVQRCDRNFWYFKRPENLDKLRNVMCSYVWQHLDVGYVQGMCDLAAPFLVIFDDELLAFSCFSRLMRRMVANFPHGCAMDQHFEILKHLMQVLDPKLYEVLQNNGDYTHFYFCYRWLLLDFKRELAYEDVYLVWETIWAAKHLVTGHFVVFLAFAMVRYYRDIIIENNMDFTDTIKFFNEMAEHHDAKGIVALAQESIIELRALVQASAEQTLSLEPDKAKEQE